MTKRSRGFTLVELLISMALFLVLSTALIALLTQAFDFLSSGTAGTEATDKGADFLRPFRADLDNVLVERGLNLRPPQIRFLCDHVPVDSDADGTVDYYAQRLAFVRSTREELADPLTRQAGTKPGAEAMIDGRDDIEEAEKGELRAAGGMMEVLYLAVPDAPVERTDGTGTSAVENPGVLTLYRATRSPIGGEGSLLDPDTVKTPADIRKIGVPFLTGVLHFGVEFMAPDSQAAGGMAPVRTWDSTRGILKPGAGLREFPFARGPESLNDPRDDISPRSLVVTFVFERTGRENEETFLVDPLPASLRSMSVGSTVFANTSEESFVKVGTEWISWSNREVSRFTGLTRGERATVAVNHRAGEVVRSGFVVRRTIPIPAHREDYNSGLR